MGSASRSRSRSRGRSNSPSYDSKSPSPAPKRGDSDTERKRRHKRSESPKGKKSPSHDDRKEQRSPRSPRKTNGADNGDREYDVSTRASSRSKSRSPVDKRRNRKSRSPKASGDKNSRSRSRSRSKGQKSRSRSRSRSRGRRGRRSRSRGYSPRRRDDDEDGYRLHVADLDAGTNKKDLEKIFGKFGPLKEIWMARSTPCFAFVVYRYREDSEEAIQKTDGIEILSRRIRVTPARPRTRGLGRRGFDPSMRCYQCGDRGHFSRDCPDSKYGYKRPPSPRGGGRYYPRSSDRGYDDRRDRDRRY